MIPDLLPNNILGKNYGCCPTASLRPVCVRLFRSVRASLLFAAGQNPVFWFHKFYLGASLIFLCLMLLSSGAFAAKLDMSAEISESADAWSNLDFASASPSNRFYILQNASFGVTLKNIRYMPDGDGLLDIGVEFAAVGINSGGALPSPFDRMASFYPDTAFKPWVRQAYLKANGLFGNEDVSIIAGRQRFVLATGMALSDNGIGMPGFRVKYDNAFWDCVGAEAFVFQPKAADASSGGTTVAGVSFDGVSDGKWQAYSFFELDKQTTAAMSVPVTGATRNFTGISYSLRLGQLSFDAEGALEQGLASGANGGQNVKFSGSALYFSGKWAQSMGKLGTGTARVAFGRASGDNPSSSGTDEAFFPSYGAKYDGFERNGYGMVFGATLYDAMGGDSSTSNGLPAGLSGIQVINLGATFDLPRGFKLDADVFFFEASVSANGQRQLGRELDLKFSWPAAAHWGFSAGYGTFSPGAAYADGTPSSSKFFTTTYARF